MSTPPALQPTSFTPWDERLDALGVNTPYHERDIELFYAHLTLSPVQGDPLTSITQLIERLPLSSEVRDHILEQPPERLLLYRTLVRNTFRSTLELALPRTIARWQDAFDVIFDDFLAKRATEGHCLRDVTSDFLSHCEANPQDNLEPYLLELAKLEALRIIVASQPDPKQDRKNQASVLPDLEHSLELAPATRLLALSHAVHRLPLALEDRSVPDKRPTFLLSYRDGDNEVRYMELSALAFALISRLLQGLSLGRALTEACSSLAEEMTPDVLTGSAQVLSDLAERGVIIRVGEKC